MLKTWYVALAAPGILSSAISNRIQTKWIAMLLNNGVDPRTNVTVIPRGAFQETTKALSIMSGVPPDKFSSIVGYGMGWWRVSHQGHEVRRRC